MSAANRGLPSGVRRKRSREPDDPPSSSAIPPSSRTYPVTRLNTKFGADSFVQPPPHPHLYFPKTTLKRTMPLTTKTNFSVTLMTSMKSSKTKQGSTSSLKTLKRTMLIAKTMPMAGVTSTTRANTKSLTLPPDASLKLV